MTRKYRFSQLSSAAFVVLLVAFSIRMYGLGDQSLWYDEGYTVFVAAHSPLFIIPRVAQGDLNTPLHYLMLHYWMIGAGASEFAGRMLSVFFGVLTVAVAGTLARMIRPASVRASLIAMLMLAVWPVSVAFSRELRMYSVCIFLDVLATVVLLRCMRNPGAHNQKWLAWAVVTLLAFGASVVSVFVFAAQAVCIMIWWFMTKRTARTHHAITVTFVTGIGIVAWATLIFLSGAGYGGTYTGRLLFPVVLLESMAAMMLPHLSPDLLVAPLAVVCILGLIPALWIGGKSRQLALITGMGIVFMAVFCSITGKFSWRYASLFVPHAVILFAVSISSMGRKGSVMIQRAQVVGVSIALITGLAGVYVLYTNEAYANDDFRGAAAYIRAHAQPDESVLLVADHLAPVYEYYAPDAANVYPLPPDIDINIAHILDYDRAAPLLNKALADRTGAWVLLWQDDVMDPAGIVPTLLRRISHKLQPDTVITQFHGVRLEHYIFDQTYSLLPEAIPPLQSTVNRDGRQAGLDGMGCGQLRAPRVGERMIEVDCFWLVKPDSGLPYDTKVSLRLYAQNNALVTQNDVMLAPVKGVPFVPYSKPLTSIYYLNIPADVPAGTYTLQAIPYTGDGELSPRMSTPLIILP